MTTVAQSAFLAACRREKCRAFDGPPVLNCNPHVSMRSRAEGAGKSRPHDADRVRGRRKNDRIAQGFEGVDAHAVVVFLWTFS
jgi:hypothetical protein